MSQVSAKLRRGEGRYFHWCPACGEMHPLPDRWTFNGNLEAPTFSPSFKHGGKKRAMENGRWIGGWVLDGDGNAVDRVCHYILTAGVLNYCDDCTHAMAGQSVPLPDIPAHLRDGDF